MSKQEAYRQGLYEFTPPPVYHGNWTDTDWIKYIDNHGRWLVEVS